MLSLNAQEGIFFLLSFVYKGNCRNVDNCVCVSCINIIGLIGLHKIQASMFVHWRADGILNRSIYYYSYSIGGTGYERRTWIKPIYSYYTFPFSLFFLRFHFVDSLNNFNRAFCL